MEKSLSQRMIDFRAREGITQTQLAKMCRVSLQTISYIEREKKIPSRITKAKILYQIEKGE